MSIFDNIQRMAGRLVGNVVATVHTRLELASVEVEEELNRFTSYLVWTLVVLVSASIAVLLTVFLLIALFWDTHRFQVLIVLIGFFACSALFLGLWLRKSMRNKPRFLHYTLEELRRDGVHLNSAGKD